MPHDTRTVGDNRQPEKQVLRYTFKSHPAGEIEIYTQTAQRITTPKGSTMAFTSRRPNKGHGERKEKEEILPWGHQGGRIHQKVSAQEATVDVCPLEKCRSIKKFRRFPCSSCPGYMDLPNAKVVVSIQVHACICAKAEMLLPKSSGRQCRFLFVRDPQKQYRCERFLKK